MLCGSISSSVASLMSRSIYLVLAETGATGCSKTLAYEIQMPGNYPEESIQHSEHGRSLKSRTFII
jgi:hypothetical protein